MAHVGGFFSNRRYLWRLVTVREAHQNKYRRVQGKYRRVFRDPQDLAIELQEL